MGDLKLTFQEEWDKIAIPFSKKLSENYAKYLIAIMSNNGCIIKNWKLVFKMCASIVFVNVDVQVNIFMSLYT